MKDHIKKVFDIYEKQYPMLLRRAVSILGNVADAEEVLQDLAVTIMERQEQFETVRNYQAFLNTLVRNRCIDAYRKNKKDTALPIDLTIEPQAAASQQAFEAVEHREMIETFLQKYPPELREAFRLHVLEGYSIREVAKQMGIPANTLVQRLRRVRLRLTKQYLLFMVFWLALG